MLYVADTPCGGGAFELNTDQIALACSCRQVSGSVPVAQTFRKLGSYGTHYDFFSSSWGSTCSQLMVHVASFVTFLCISTCSCVAI